jgi:hypothetical protein
MSTDSSSLQARVNKRISRFVPRYVWRSTVAIVVANRPKVHLLGSGSLFQIGKYYFIVTAAHVIRLAHEYDRTIGISSDAGSLSSVHGEWITSAPNLPEDSLDIAVYQISDRVLGTLKQSWFTRIADADFGREPKSAAYTVFGHPAIWARPSGADDEKVQLKGLEYTSYTYERSARDLSGYDPKYHLLLDAESEEITWTDGTRAEFKRADGTGAVFPRELKGISGAPVCRIGDLGVPINGWHSSCPKLVGVQTGIYQPSQAIRVTRWIAVTTLIHAAFPELKATIESS